MRRETSHEKQIRLVMKRGYHQNTDRNIKALYSPQRVKLLTFEGVMAFPTPPGFYALLSFDGPTCSMTGEFRFTHWDTEVLTVNFDEGWITDHGYRDYSITTDRNLAEWRDALLRFLPPELPWNWHRWTANGRRHHQSSRCQDPRGLEPEIDETMATFRSGVPWVRPEGPFRRDRAAPSLPWAWERPWGPGTRNTTWRFYWRKYDAELANAFWKSKEFLSEDLNRRYFKYDWRTYVPQNPRPHDWVRSFINPDAERRWRAREKRNGRACPPISSLTKMP